MELSKGFQTAFYGFPRKLDIQGSLREYHVDIWTCCVFSVISLVVKSEGKSMGMVLDRGMLVASRGLVSGRLG